MCLFTVYLIRVLNLFCQCVFCIPSRENATANGQLAHSELAAVHVPSGWRGHKSYNEAYSVNPSGTETQETPWPNPPYPVETIKLHGRQWQYTCRQKKYLQYNHDSPKASQRLLWCFSGLSLYWYLPLLNWLVHSGKYQNKEKPLKHQRRLGLTQSHQQNRNVNWSFKYSSEIKTMIQQFKVVLLSRTPNLATAIICISNYTPGTIHCRKLFPYLVEIASFRTYLIRREP